MAYEDVFRALASRKAREQDMPDLEALGKLRKETEMAGRKARGGYRYVVTEEQIAAWRKVPPIEKLRWIEEGQRMSFHSLGPRGRAARDRLRRGEI